MSRTADKTLFSLGTVLSRFPTKLPVALAACVVLSSSVVMPTLKSGIGPNGRLPTEHWWYPQGSRYDEGGARRAEGAARLIGPCCRARLRGAGPGQQFLVAPWRGGRRELCVVGDPSQTVYSFTGATPHNLLAFPRTYPEATVVRLVRDYRSTPHVVGLANAPVLRGVRAAGLSLALVTQPPRGPPVPFATLKTGASPASATDCRTRSPICHGPTSTPSSAPDRPQPRPRTSLLTPPHT